MTVRHCRTVRAATLTASLSLAAVTLGLGCNSQSSPPAPSAGAADSGKANTRASAVDATSAPRSRPVPGATGAATATAGPQTRQFLFTYGTTVTGLEPGQVAKIWLPVPPSTDEQWVRIVEQSAPGRIGEEPKYGNQILYVEAAAGDDGTVPVSVTYRVTRNEVRGGSASPVSQSEAERFLKPDQKVPVGGKPLTLVKGKQLPTDPMQLGRALYDVVNAHMVYSKDKPGWGTGDAEWACDSRFGNCSDFHSLFISLARTNRMPAKFEMGFPIPEQRGSGEVKGYHCWAKFAPAGRGWVPVDISEADKHPEMTDYYFGNLTADRVAFTVGRDITLVPEQAGPPLNFFIYPYVEVGGKPHPAEQLEKKFAYRDIDGATASAR